MNSQPPPAASPPKMMVTSQLTNRRAGGDEHRKSRSFSTMNEYGTASTQQGTFSPVGLINSPIPTQGGWEESGSVAQEAFYPRAAAPFSSPTSHTDPSFERHKVSTGMSLRTPPSKATGPSLPPHHSSSTSLESHQGVPGMSFQEAGGMPASYTTPGSLQGSGSHRSVQYEGAMTPPAVMGNEAMSGMGNYRRGGRPVPLPGPRPMRGQVNPIRPAIDPAGAAAAAAAPPSAPPYPYGGGGYPEEEGFPPSSSMAAPCNPYGIAPTLDPTGPPVMGGGMADPRWGAPPSNAPKPEESSEKKRSRFQPMGLLRHLLWQATFGAQDNTSAGANVPIYQTRFGCPEDDLPLFEELGVNVGAMMSKGKATLDVFHEPSREVVENNDLAGPIIFAVCIAALLLFQGKVEFNSIYCLLVVGTLGFRVLLPLMSGVPTSLTFVTSSLGYALLPCLILAMAQATQFWIYGKLPNALFPVTVAMILWAAWSASSLLCTGLQLVHQKYLVLYPCILFYSFFAALTVL